MPYLKYIDDEPLRDIVKTVLLAGINSKKAAEKVLGKNVLDPFSALLQSGAFELDFEGWKNVEIVRQSQKSMQNQVGEMHQKVLGNVSGWQDLGTGGIIDVYNPGCKIIAEIKNKYNTVSGGDLANTYDGLYDHISLKTSTYKDCTAYFVNIIPNRPNRSNKPFTPSDRQRGKKKEENEKIRIIDGASFYELVTGRKDALRELFEVLPQVITDVMREDLEYYDFEFQDVTMFTRLYDDAYGLDE